MTKYKVKHTTIMHNQKLYAEGSEIELTNEQAKRLEDFVELIPETSTKTTTKNQTAGQTKAKTATKSETKKETKTETKSAEGSDGGQLNDK